MAEVFDYVGEVYDRLLAIVTSHADAAAMLRVANVSQPADRRRYGIHTQPNAPLAGSFPRLELELGDHEDSAYDPAGGDFTIGGEPGDAFRVRQVFTWKLTHEALNVAKNSRETRIVQEAVRQGVAGGAAAVKLALRGQPLTALDYVIGWGPVTTRRTREFVFEGVREVSRIAIPVHMEFGRAEPDPGP